MNPGLEFVSLERENVGAAAELLALLQDAAPLSDPGERGRAGHGRYPAADDDHVEVGPVFCPPELRGGEPDPAVMHMRDILEK